MDYRFIRSVRTKGRFAEWRLPLVFIGAIVLFHFFYPTALGHIAARVALPFWRTERFAEDALVRASLFFASRRTLMRDVETLNAELKRAKSLLADRELLLQENRLLREQFGRVADSDRRLLGEILAAPPRSLYDTAVIDIGTRDGVAVGDLALSGSVILGTVEKTFARTSLITFFSTAGNTIPVLILHDGSATPIEAKGEGGGAFRARLPKEVSLRVGDYIVLPGESALVFAAVSAIEGNAADSFQTVRFRNPVSVQSLRFLEIKKATAVDTP